MENILYITVYTIDVLKQYIKLNNNHLLISKIPRKADKTEPYFSHLIYRFNTSKKLK